MTELEDLFADFLRAQERTQRTVDQTSREMREFKAEMRAWREDSAVEMREFKAENNKRWGELANKLGTLAEDLVAPSVPRILRTVVHCPDDQVEFMAVRVRRLHPADRGRSQEFDVMAVCGEFLLFNETRTRLTPASVDEFVDTLSRAREFFPEYGDKKIIGAVASLYVDESLVRYAEKQGLLALGLGEDLMDVLNAPGFTPREF